MNSYPVPDKAYIIEINDNGSPSCDCPAAKYQKGECKHIRAMRLANPERFEVALSRPKGDLADYEEKMKSDQENTWNEIYRRNLSNGSWIAVSSCRFLGSRVAHGYIDLKFGDISKCVKWKVNFGETVEVTQLDYPALKFPKAIKEIILASLPTFK